MADLLKWGKDRLKQANGIQHQINPWDNGRTYDTNQRGVDPGTPNPTNIKSDNTPGFQLTNNSLTRGLSRGYDQANIWDNGKSWKQRTANTERSAFAQSTPILKSLIKAPAQMINTGIDQARQLPNAIEGNILAHQALDNTNKMLEAQKRGDVNEYERRKEIAGRFSDVLAQNNAQEEIDTNRFNQESGGLFNAGTFYNAEDSRRGDLKTGLTKIGGGTLQTMATVAPFAKGGSVAVLLGKGTPLLTKAAAMGAEGLAYGGTYSAGQQLQDNGRIDPKQLIRDAVIGGATSAAIPVVGAGVRQVINGGAKDILPAIAAMKPSSVAARHPAVQELEAKMGQLNEQRGQMLAGGMKETHPAVKANDRAFAAAAQEKQATLKSIQQGGYIKVPGGGKEIPKEVPKPKTDGLAQVGKSEISKEAEANTLMEAMTLPSTTPADMVKIKARMQELAGTVPGKVKDTATSAVNSTGQTVLKKALKPGQAVPTPPVPGAATAGRVPSKLVPGEVPQTGPVPLPDKLKASSASSVEPPHSLNVDKFNVTQKAKKALADAQTGLKDEIESVRGKRLTNKEVREHMEATKTILKDPKTRAATKDYLAGLQTLREDNAALITKRGAGTLTPEESIRLNEGLLKQTQAAADAGRTLRSFREVADPRERTVLDVMIKKIASTDANMKEVSAALKKLGPNATPKEQAEFYRTFVKATKEDWLDKYRYTNMLSSPLTHIVNTSSNMAGVFGVAPVQKLYEGAVDAARSVVTRGPRTRFAGEAGSYIKGSVKSVPDALKNFRDVMLDKKITGNPDMDSLRNIPLATHGPKAVADKVLSFVPKLLEAGDQFATTLSQGGEEAGLLKRAAHGVKVDTSPASLAKITDEAARYRLFRQELNKTGQGHLLDAVDIPAQTISKMRQSKNPYVRTISKFTVPFVATPTNIFKQGIEYSPLGVFTLHGSADKTAQVAKMLMGTTTVATAAGALAAGGDITFGEPTNSDQRDAFRAEGKQPYSFKLPGSDKWVNYSKMHPAIAMNLAIVGAVKDAQDKGSLSDSQADKIMNTGAGIINYFTDQSYMKNVGDFVNVLSGKDNVSAGSVISSQATNDINQTVPFKSLTSWIGRQIDPTQRKISSKDPAWLQTYQGVVKDIPGLNKDINTRKNPYTGEDLKNPLPIFNSFSPNKVSVDKGYGNTTGLNLEQRQQNRDLPVDQREPFRRNVIEQKAIEKQATAEKNAMQDGKATPFKSNSQASSGGQTNSEIKPLSNGKFYAQVDGKYSTFDSKEKAQKAIDVSNFKAGNEKKKLVGDTYYLKNDSEQGYTTKKKVEYDFDQTDSKLNLEMDRAKSNDDVNSWLDNAQQRYDGYQKLIESYDPETEQDKINNLTKKMEDLKDQADTYNEYGGFKKPKTGSKANHHGFQDPASGKVDQVGKDTRSLITSVAVSKAARLRRKF